MSAQNQKSDEWHAAGIDLDPTDVPNLDLILGGGLPHGSLALVIGPPGSGKTTLANQMAFGAAARGRRAVVVTALSESTSKLLSHLRSFSFYVDQFVGDQITVVSLDQYLSSGLTTARDELIQITRKTRASVVVLDGFRGVRGAEEDIQAARHFLYDVGGTLSTLGVTTIITSEADPRDPHFFPESTAADVIIGLHYDLVVVQQRRAIEIIKMRGAEPMPGLHGIWLNGSGLTVYPRVEARSISPHEAIEPTEATLEEAERLRTQPLEKVAFGLSELDTLLSGGLPRGSSTLVIGSLGTGKTTLALHFAVAGVQLAEPTVYVSFRENLTQLLQKASAFALGHELLAGLAVGGGLILQHWTPVELKPDIVADRLVAAVDRVQARRLVVDSVAELEHALYESGQPERTESYLGAIVDELRKRAVTTLFIREHEVTVARQLQLAPGPVAVLAENVLLLQHIEDDAALHRVLSVVKMRVTPHDAVLHEFTISPPDGIRLLGQFRRHTQRAGTSTSREQVK